MKKNPLIVYLTGGLGNQLFQLANAISLEPEREILLEWALGKPRCNSFGMPDIQSFRLPDRVKFMPVVPYSILASKTAGYLLRSGIAPKWWETKHIYQKTTLLLGSAILSIHFRRLLNIIRGTGIGYSTIKAQSGTGFIIGYFQSYKFTEKIDVYQELKKLSLATKNVEVEGFRKLAIVEEPIVVHFRFGDYKLEDSFGIPGFTYYKKALDELTRKYPRSKIWVFTDEVQAAEKVFPAEFLSSARWFINQKLTSAETLEIMRLGTAYIIANSTFSWWGAILSNSDNPEVICPDVWFKSQSEPLDLIPTNWKRVPAWQ